MKKQFVNALIETVLFDEKDIILSEKTVKISGAKTEIDKIISAYADISVTDYLEENLTVDAPVRLTNGSTDTIKYVQINGENSINVPVTLPVYKVLTLPVSVSFKNSPSHTVSRITFAPAQTAGFPPKVVP